MRILIKIIFIFFLSGSFCVSLDLKWDLVYAYFNYNVGSVNSTLSIKNYLKNKDKLIY